MVSKLNYWDVVKVQDRWKEIEIEVNETDFSTAHPKYVICKYALLNDISSFLKLLPSLFKNGDINLSELEKWPIFRNIRKDVQYTMFLKSHIASTVPINTKNYDSEHN